MENLQFKQVDASNVRALIEYLSTLTLDEAKFAIENDSIFDEYGISEHKEDALRYIADCKPVFFSKDDYIQDEESEIFRSDPIDTILQLRESDKYKDNLNSIWCNAYCCTEESIDGKTARAIPVSEVYYDGGVWVFSTSNCGRMTLDSICNSISKVVNSCQNALFASLCLSDSSEGNGFKYWWSDDKNKRIFFFNEIAKNSLGLVHPGDNCRIEIRV